MFAEDECEGLETVLKRSEVDLPEVSAGLDPSWVPRISRPPIFLSAEHRRRQKYIRGQLALYHSGAQDVSLLPPPNAIFDRIAALQQAEGEPIWKRSEKTKRSGDRENASTLPDDLIEGRKTEDEPVKATIMTHVNNIQLQSSEPCVQEQITQSQTGHEEEIGDSADDASQSDGPDTGHDKWKAIARAAARQDYVLPVW